MAKQHIVGIRINTKSEQYKNKIYYYKTDQDLKRGEELRIKAPSGGTPIAKVAVGNSKKPPTNAVVKDLKRTQ